MKKWINLFLFIVVFQSFQGEVVTAENDNIVCKKNSYEISVNQKIIEADAYIINGYSFFKIRDVATMLDYTGSQFRVDWVANSKIIKITTGEKADLEMEPFSRPEHATAVARRSQAGLMIDESEFLFEVYHINGYNYFKLRDLGNAIGFQVAWDSANSKIMMTTKKNFDNLQVISPWEYQSMLGKGMDVDWSKTNQGMNYYNEQAVKDFVDAGISHVRIRVSQDANENIFKSLDKQINDCIENGLIPIIAYQADDLKNKPNEKNIEKTVQWWGTVANRYQHYSSILSFDLLIEATDSLNEQPELLNEIYEKITSEIRKTNPARILMFSPRMRSDASYLKELVLPSQHNGFVMAQWHFYASGPSKTNERKLWTTGTVQEKNLILEKIQLALEWQQSTGIPTWVGAWMPGNYNDGDDYSISEQAAFAQFMKASLESAGIPFAVNSDTKFYNREQNEWIEKMIPVFQVIYGNGN